MIESRFLLVCVPIRQKAALLSAFKSLLHSQIVPIPQFLFILEIFLTRLYI